jgi:hypothetical protein
MEHQKLWIRLRRISRHPDQDLGFQPHPNLATPAAGQSVDMVELRRHPGQGSRPSRCSTMRWLLHTRRFDTDLRRPSLGLLRRLGISLLQGGMAAAIARGAGGKEGSSGGVCTSPVSPILYINLFPGNKVFPL